MNDHQSAIPQILVGLSNGSCAWMEINPFGQVRLADLDSYSNGDEFIACDLIGAAPCTAHYGWAHPAENQILCEAASTNASA